MTIAERRASRPATRVVVATPYGESGRGGIDRLNDALFNALASQPDLKIEATRLPTRGKRGLLAAQLVFIGALLRFLALATFNKVDVLHIHISGDGSSIRKAVLGLLSAAVRVPYVLHYHGSNFRDFYRRMPLWRPVLRAAYRRSKRVVVLGRVWGDLLQDYYPEIKDRIVVVPNACAAPTPTDEPSARKADVTHFVFLGRLEALKGTPELIRALAALGDRPGWTATLAGNGDVDQARAAVAAAHIQDRVSLPGWLNEADCERLLRNADVLLLPSHTENMPMSIIEAFAHGLAVIATPVGAVPEVITDGVSGLLVPVGDEAALKAAIERLLDDTTLRQRLGAAAKESHAARYDIQNYVCRLAQLWHEAIAQAAGDPLLS